MITLYVKTHNVTGLKYFGKTTAKDAHKYRGSGKYWLRHIKKHGNDVTTTIVGVFEDVDECERVALAFSTENQIVESDNWANFRPENGRDGAPIGHPGHVFTEEQVEKLKEGLRNRWATPGFKERVAQSHRNRWTDELRQKQTRRMREEFWTDDRRKAHSAKLAGRKMGSSPVRRKPKPEGFGQRVSQALRGKPKSAEHIAKMQQPKPRVCRLTDRKEMSVNHFTRWITLCDAANSYSLSP